MRIFQREKWYSLSSVQTIFFIITITLILTIFFLSIQPIAVWDVLKNIITYPMMFLNNYYPVLLITVLLVAITGRVGLSLGIIYLLFSILGLVNRMKIMYRDFPLIPSDLMLIREAGSISASAGYAPDWKIVIFIVIGFIFLLELLLRLECPKINIPVRLIGGGLSIAIFVGLLFTLYGSRDYYYSLPNYEANYNEVISSNIRGFHYYFLYNISAYGYAKPADYDENEVMAWEEDMEKENQQKSDESLGDFQEDKKPHLIFVMGEAFTDIADHPTFIFTEENHPLAGYNKMKEESVLSGNIVATVFGGGTENTEYDVLTGNQVLYQSDGNVSAYKSLKGRTYSLGWLFKDLGYETYGMHPGEPWFYNRQNAYEYLGLDNNYFKDDFEDPEMKGLYISEDEFTKNIIDDFENHIDESDDPMFYYSVSIQNHGPYLNYKYDEDERFDYETTIDLQPEVKEQFDNLFVGIKDMSDALEDMGDYFSEEEDPIILVYFGDHQPFLGEDYMAYRAIDYDLYSWNGESFLRSRTTPFLIWANDSGRKYLDTSELDLPEDNRISANYLGTMLLEILGLDVLDPYYSYINYLRREFPVLSRNFIVKADEQGSTTIIDYGELPEEDLAEIEKFKKWQYYRLNNFRENDFD